MPGDWYFVLADSLEKVYPDRSPRPIDPDIPLSVVLGETASFQLAYRPPLDPGFRDPRPLRVSVQGAASAHVAVSAVVVVPCSLVAFPGHDDGYDRDTPGLYPDLLRPLDGEGAPVMFGHWSSLWFDFAIDDEEQAGPHELVIVVSNDDGAPLHRETVTIEVLAMRLPELDIVSSHWIHADAIADHYGVEVFGEEHWRLVGEFMSAASQMGANSLLAPVWTPPLDTAVGRYRTPVQLVDIGESEGGYVFGFERLQRWLELCRENGITRVEIAHLFTQWGAEFTPAIYVRRGADIVRAFGWDVRATDPAYCRLLEQLLPELCALLDREWGRDRVVFHVSDEPFGEAALANYLAAKAQVADLLDGWTIVDALSEYAFYQSGAVPVPIVATDHVAPFLDDRPPALWVYYCVAQDREVANRFVGMPSLRNRVIGHQLFAFNIDGFLHWGFNFYYSAESRRLIDPFADTSAGGAFPSGDPFIVYPGPRGPLASIRYRVFTQAMWDHRAMQALRDRDGRESVMELIDPDGSLAFNRFSYDPAHYLAVRARINERLR